MLQKLKTECGSAFTSRLEGMFRDIEVSKEHVNVFNGQAGNPKNSQSSPLEFAVSVLTQGIWPNYTPIEVTLPPEMTSYLVAFQKFYVGSHNGRKLQWLPNLGQCRVKANFTKGPKELTVSQLQAVVLLLFNNVDELNFMEVHAATTIELEELKRVMGSLCTPKVKVLNKTGPPNIVSSSDTFSYAPDFTSKAFRIKINAIQAQETVSFGGCFVSRFVHNPAEALSWAIFCTCYETVSFSAECVHSSVECKEATTVLDRKRNILIASLNILHALRWKILLCHGGNVRNLP